MVEKVGSSLFGRRRKNYVEVGKTVSKENEIDLKVFKRRWGEQKHLVVKEKMPERDDWGIRRIREHRPKRGRLTA